MYSSSPDLQFKFAGVVLLVLMQWYLYMDDGGSYISNANVNPND